MKIKPLVCNVAHHELQLCRALQRQARVEPHKLTWAQEPMLETYREEADGDAACARARGAADAVHIVLGGLGQVVVDHQLDVLDVCARRAEGPGQARESAGGPKGGGRHGAPPALPSWGLPHGCMPRCCVPAQASNHFPQPALAH